MKNRAVLLAASVLFLAVPAFAQRPEDRRPNEQRGEENTMSTDRMRLAPIKGASPIPPAPRITLRPSLAGPQGRRARQHLAACEQWSLVWPRQAQRQALSSGSSVRTRTSRTFRPILPVQSGTIRRQPSYLLVPRGLFVSDCFLGLAGCGGLVLEL